MVTEHLSEGHIGARNEAARHERDITGADVVISIGCDLTHLPVAPRTLQKWDEVPGPSEDLKGADDAIRRRVIALVEELLAEQRK